MTIVNPLTWVLCPILDLADGVYGLFTSVLQDMLNVKEGMYNTAALKTSWAAMRNIASSLIVLVALAMIASQIFSFEFMSAYTVKKVLPRLIIAAIAIQLSWFIFTTLIAVINDIGIGIYSLMLAPFGLNGAGSDIVDMIGTQSEGAKLFSGTLLLIGAGAGFIAVGGLAGIVAAAIAVGVGMIVAIATLILRKMLIIALLVLAPLALVAWILPGTQKFWTSWWNLYIKLLLMFPLIMVLIASGKIFASLIKDQPGAATPLIIIIAYFLPLFLIPGTFKFAGGIFSQVSTKMSGMGSKFGGGIAKPWKERAQLNKDNSSWALSRKSRMADRQRTAQLRHADRMTGSDAYSRFTQLRSGTSARGRQRAQSNAASLITADEDQAFKERTAYAAFQVSEVADTYKDAQGNYMIPDSNGVRRQVTKFQALEKARSDIIGDGSVGQRTINGLQVNATRELMDDTAIKGLSMKDRNDTIYNYTHSDEGSRSLNDLGTSSPEAFGVLSKHAPQISKGEVGARSRITTTDNRGFEGGLDTFSDIAHVNDRNDIATTLSGQINNSATRSIGLANLARLVHSPSFSSESLSELTRPPGQVDANGNPLPVGIFHGADLATLRADKNAVATWDPAANGGAGGIVIS